MNAALPIPSPVGSQRSRGSCPGSFAMWRVPALPRLAHGMHHSGRGARLPRNVNERQQQQSEPIPALSACCHMRAACRHARRSRSTARAATASTDACCSRCFWQPRHPAAAACASSSCPAGRAGWGPLCCPWRQALSGQTWEPHVSAGWLRHILPPAGLPASQADSQLHPAGSAGAPACSCRSRATTSLKQGRSSGRWAQHSLLAAGAEGRCGRVNRLSQQLPARQQGQQRRHRS